MDKKEFNKNKKVYTTPQMLASDVRTASQSVCGWYTQCGKQVQSRQ